MFRNEAEAFQPNYYRDPTGEITLSERINQFDTPTDIDIYTAKLDYETDFMKGKLGLGAKSAIVRTDNTFDFYDVENGERVFNSGRSNTFTYEEKSKTAKLEE